MTTNNQAVEAAVQQIMELADTFCNASDSVGQMLGANAGMDEGNVYWVEMKRARAALEAALRATIALPQEVAAPDEYDIQVLRELSATLIHRSPERHSALERVLAASRSPATAGVAGGVGASKLLEQKLSAMVKWLEANQPDVFKRGIWDAIESPAANGEACTDERMCSPCFSGQGNCETTPASREQDSVPAGGEAFQSRVQPWMMACFGPAISANVIERNHRFLEESLELVQSTGCTQSEAHQLVDYVYGRPAGDTPQEVGGVMVTLAALCLAHPGLDMHACGEVELARIWTCVEKIRAKQAAKPAHSPLPEAAQPILAQDAAPAVAVEVRSDKDYAIEHAEYMATAAERFAYSVDALDAAHLLDGETPGGADDAVNEAQANYSEARKALSSYVYEFRKRRDRVAAPSVVQPTPVQDADQAWAMAMAEALGLSSGYAVPLVPSKDAFVQLFQQIRGQDAKDARLIGLLREARATLEMWKDVAPAFSLCRDIDAAILSSEQDQAGGGDKPTDPYGY